MDSNILTYRPSPLMSLPLVFHIVFMVVSAVTLILGYRSKKQLHQLILLAAILSSALIYFVDDGVTFYILAFEETALFIWTVVLMRIEESREERKEKERAKDTEKKDR